MKPLKPPIKCLHESSGSTGGCDNVVLPDYHPLTGVEIAELLQEAKKAKHVGDLALIHGRPNQGIVNMVCPRPATGVLARKIVELYDLLLKERRRGGNPALVKKMQKIMTS